MNDAAPEPAPRPPPCPNCGAPVAGRFCGSCGQERRSLRVPLHRLVGEAAGEIFSVDSRIARTLGPLFLRPGAVTRAYLDGRRASYTSPPRLYLLLSFVFFVVVAIRPDRSEPLDLSLGAAGAPAAAPADRELQASEDGLRQLRSLGSPGARLADKLEEIAREPPGEVRRRVQAGFSEKAPRAMFFLVPVMALLLRLLYRRSGLYLAEHAVFALHEHAVAFAFLLPGAVLGGAADTAGLAAVGLHSVLAMRRVYGQGWAATARKAAILWVAYLLALGAALLAAAVLALLAA